MRLHRLSMTAIGPFAGRVCLELARFGESGLFLIEGPTGSGKSTILDAISFALYGKLAQRSAVVERLESHHLPAGTEPVVELVFETQQGLYRIRRTPSYRRPKKRGTGTITANMTVKLWRLNSADELTGGELLSHNIGDAEDEITRAVGLSHAQFVQTVLLPQGEFANFLHADTTAKRALLHRLFGTELLARTQDELVEGRRLAEQRRAGALDSVRRTAHALVGAVGMPAERATELLERAEAGDRAGLAEQLAEVLAELAAAEAGTAAEHQAATAERLLTDAAVQRGQDLHRRRQARDELRREQQRLAGLAGQVAATRAELADAERALPVLGSAQALVDAIARSDAAQDAQAAARTALPEELYGADEARLRAVAAQHRTTIGELSDELRRERELTRLRAEHEQLVRDGAGQARLIDRATARLATLPSQQAKLAGERERCAVAAGQLPGLIAERERAAGRLRAAQQAQAAERLATAEQAVAQELYEAAEQQRRRFELLRSRWLASIASELGLALQSGDPCAVCGSIEHPKPARPTAQFVSRDDVQAAERELHSIDSEVDTRRQQLAARRTELADLRARADQLSPDAAQATLERASGALAEAEQAAGRLAGLDSELAELADQLGRLAIQLQQTQLLQAQLTERSTALLATIERDELAVHQARFGYPSVAARIAELTADIGTLDRAAEASATASAALAGAQRAGTAFTAALATAGFADQREWQAAQRDSAAIAALRGHLREHDRATASVLARLATPELADPELDLQLPELTGLTERATLAAQAEDRAARSHGAAIERHAAAGTHAGHLERALQLSAKVLAATGPAIRLGNLVAGLGENQLKMELTTYLLVRRFAEIVAAANSQLHRISGGRYQLEHTDARTGNARSGLGLRVLDLHTGRPRDPGTLSGGETFYVSLALALGLADIVRAESGGIDLGTLFIDEGFGSLDPEVLDQVIAVLDGLRAGGRAVGVVSHVSELKMRIADRIQVVRTPDGSSRLVSTV